MAAVLGEVAGGSLVHVGTHLEHVLFTEPQGLKQLSGSVWVVCIESTHVLKRTGVHLNPLEVTRLSTWCSGSMQI